MKKERSVQEVASLPPAMRDIQPASRWMSLAQLTWLLAILAIAGALIAFALGLFLAITTGDTSTLISHQLLTPLVTAAYAIVGALVASRHPRNPIGWIFLAVSWLYMASIAEGMYDTYAPALFGPDSLAALSMNLWIPALFLPTTFVFLLFPDGHLISPRWRVIFWSAVLGLVGTLVALALHPGPVPGWGVDANPNGIVALTDELDIVLQAAQMLLGIGLVGSIAAFAFRFRRSRGVEREQMKWLGYAISLMLLSFIPGAIVWSLWPDNALASELNIMMTNLSVLGIALATSVAILRYRLYDIDVVINRTLVYGALTAGVVGAYALVVGGMGVLFQSSGNLIVTLVATGLVAVLFQPLRERLQLAVNRLMYGERDDPLGALTQLGRRLEAAIAPEVVLHTLVENIAQTLKLPYVAISLRAGDEFKIAARTGDKVIDTLELPLIYQGETVGRLIAGPRGPGESFNQADRRLLEHIARQAGPAVRAVQLTSALQRSRQQLVSAREEERRRLRRDLHDGLGATLAALHLEAGALRRAVHSDPQKAEVLVNEFRANIRAAIDEIRRLVYELRPPTLDQLGLVEAVRTLARQCSRADANGDARLQVKVDAPDTLPSLPAAVEVAAYRIVQEALTNVVHHAQAQHCVVRLELADELKVEVVDDGVGLGNSHQQNKGLGLLSMRERAEELGGACLIESAAEGGTHVLASLPILET